MIEDRNRRYWRALTAARLPHGVFLRQSLKQLPVAIVTLLVGALALAGCSAPTVAIPTFTTTEAPVPANVTPSVVVSEPEHVSIPRIGADSSLVAVGLVNGAIDIPPATQPLQAAWWDGSPRPGAVGPAVILGHVDGQIGGRRGQPGVFNRLAILRPGDAVSVRRRDGSTVHFTVYKVEKTPKAAFPADRVYGNTDGPELRLITCGGVFDRTARSYEDNIVAYAREAA